MPSFRTLTRRARSAGALLVLALLLSAPAVPARAVQLTSTWDARDFIILYSAGYYRRWFPGAGLFYFDGADFSAMKAGEPVWIVAHGAVGETGRKNAFELLNLFTARGLPAATPHVYLFSCESGSTDGTHPRSLVDQLGTEMRTASWKSVQVVGADGCSITDAAVQRENSERVIRPGKEGDILAIQASLEAKLRPQADIDRYLADYEKRNGHPPSIEERAEYAYLYSLPTRTFFADLLRQADAANLLYPPGQGFKTSP